MAGKKLSQAQRAAAKLLREVRTDHLRGGTILAEIDTGLTPLLPQNLVAPTIYREHWFNKEIHEQFKLARTFLGENDFYGGVHYVKHNYFSEGFRFLNQDSKTKAWLKKYKKFDFQRLSDDIWTEWLLCDNVVAVWFKPKTQGTLPTVTILDCEICIYTDVMGIEKLMLKLPKNSKIDAGVVKQLGPKWAEAMKTGKPVEVDPNKGEYFKVLTRAKKGQGFCRARIGQIVTELSTLDLLEIADWSGAWMHKNIARQIVKGHSVNGGPDAGSTKHFLTVAQQKRIMRELKNKSGAFDVVTPHDLKFVYNFLDPRFFDMKKYEGTMMRLERWAGAAGNLLNAGSRQDPLLMDSFEQEGRKNREMVKGFMEDIINDENFIGEETAPPQDLEVGWNPNSFRSMKFILEYIRLMNGNGLMSPQTAREIGYLDEDQESARMLAASKNPKKYTPVFEAKQGNTSGKGGRPSDSAATTTALPAQPGEVETGVGD
jgi:hypothetical protein